MTSCVLPTYVHTRSSQASQSPILTWFPFFQNGAKTRDLRCVLRRGAGCTARLESRSKKLESHFIGRPYSLPCPGTFSAWLAIVAGHQDPLLVGCVYLTSNRYAAMIWAMQTIRPGRNTCVCLRTATKLGSPSPPRVRRSQRPCTPMTFRRVVSIIWHRLGLLPRFRYSTLCGNILFECVY